MADQSGAPRWDGEISVRAVLYSSLGLVGLGLVAALSMYFLQTGTQDRLESRDTPPRPVAREIPDARVGPKLQMSPDLDQVAMEAEDATRLGSWAWVDEGKGIVRMPIADAVEWVAERGVDAATVAVSSSAPSVEAAPAMEEAL